MRSSQSGEVSKGDGVKVAVRHGEGYEEAVPDAVIVATRIDMALEDMATMDALLCPCRAMKGVYNFKTVLGMAGRCGKHRGKVQGEPETVKGEVIYTAKVRYVMRSSVL